jgi:hypothetical protein
MGRMPEKCKYTVTELRHPAGQGLLEYLLLLLLVTFVTVLLVKALGNTLNSDYYQPANIAITGAGNH